MKVNYFNNLGLISTVNTGICVHVRKLIKNQVLKKPAKHHNLVNVNSKELLLYGTSLWDVLFYILLRQNKKNSKCW